MGLPNPITTIGSSLENIGKGLGGAATTGNGWIADRAKDVVHGDAFGFGRRENEELRRTFEEKLDTNNSTLADQREQLDKDAGKSENAELAGDKARGGALSKDLDASYTVADGDTLNEIAQEKGKSVDDLLGLNPELGDGNLIRPGQEIKLDDFVAQEGPAGEIQALATPAASTPEADTELQT